MTVSVAQGPPSTVRTAVENGARPHIPLYLPGSLKCLMEACWSHRRKDRPPFKAIVRVLDEAIAVRITMRRQNSRALRTTSVFLLRKRVLTACSRCRRSAWTGRLLVIEGQAAVAATPEGALSAQYNIMADGSRQSSYCSLHQGVT